MSARNTFEDDLKRLNDVRADPHATGAPEVLRAALAARSNLLVARAAEIITEWELSQYSGELNAAFDRFLIDPVRRDPTCAAKIAIAEALNAIEARDAGLFLRGIRHVQPEPVWGGQEDTAARLRATCAIGLARSDPPDTLLELAGLLADPEIDARIGAARAIAYATRPGGGPLLWFKALIGDEEPIVMAECFAALLALEPEQAVGLVGERILDEDPALAEAAMMALGNSRPPGARLVLVDGWARLKNIGLRRIALVAVAAVGDDESFSFLLDLVASGSTVDASDALAAMARFREDERRRRKIERVLRRRVDLPDYSTT